MAISNDKKRMKHLLSVTDLSTLTREQMDQRNEYWASRSLNERFEEMMRLNIAKWGEKAFEKMDKSKFEIVTRDRR